MRKSQTRGGEGLSDYRISDILGPKFEDFVKTLKASGYNSFLTNDKDKTLRYDFTEYIIAVAAAFSQIENPNITRSKETERYGQAFEDIFRGLLSGTQTNIKTLGSVDIKPLKFNQLPYDHRFLKDRQLVPGFHLFPYDKDIYPKHIAGPNNALINALLYIYFFIAQLKTEGLSGGEVIGLLQQDNLTYNNYVLEIKDILSSSKYYTERPDFPAGADIISSINRGLTAAAEIMIRDFNNDTKTPPALDLKDNTGAINIAEKFKDFGTATVNVANKASTAAYFKSIGLSTARANTIYDELTKLISLHAKGGKFSKADPAPAGELYMPLEELNNKLFNSLLNPYYLNTVVVDKDPLCADLGKLGLTAAVTAPKPLARTIGTAKMPTKGGHVDRYPYQYGGAKAISLRFLYDPKGKDESGKCTITTEDEHFGVPGTNFADPTKIAALLTAIPHVNNTGAAGSEEYIKNTAIIILTILHYLIMSGTDFVSLSGAQKTELVGKIEEAIINYRTLHARLLNVPTDNFDKRFGGLAEEFAAEFSRTAYESIKYTKEGKYEALTEAREKTEKKNTLNTQIIKEFYENHVSKNIKFYSDYFNIVEVATNKGFELTDPRVANIKEADLDKYRLNVKTLKGYARLGTMSGGQVGGQWGRIVFAGQLPSITTEGIIAIYVTRDKLVSLVGQSADEIKRIVDQVYEAAAAGITTIPITVGGETVNISLVQIAATAATKPSFSQSYSGYIKSLLTNVIKNAAGVTAPSFELKPNEYELNEHLLRRASEWVRDEADADGNSNTFVRFGKDGKVIEEELPSDTYACAFFNDHEDVCVNFFTSCMDAERGKLSDICSKLLDLNFNVKLGAKTVSEKIAKMNPAAAFQILGQFGFGSYLDSDNDPIYGIRRYKVQSVGSWVQELYSGTTTVGCKRIHNPNSEQPCPLQEWLGPDNVKRLIDLFESDKGQGFYSYLEVLVNWVNANPQVLNPAEVKNPSYALGRYPEPNKSFDLYKYQNPYKPAHLRLRDFSCGLERLKGSIMNELVGSNASSMISTMSSIPLGLEMPFSRPGFVNALPFNNFVPMMGGGNGYYMYEQQIKDNSFQYGHSLFDAIYKDLLGTMTTMSDSKKLRLSGPTQDKIKEKLEKFKEVENELIAQLRMAIEQNRLTQASHGYINGFITDDRAKLNALLSKHANLLNVSSAYNKKAINLIDLFQAIAKAVLGKLDTTENNTSTGYERPMNTQLRSQFDGKKI